MVGIFEALDTMLEAPFEWIISLPMWIRILFAACLPVLAIIGCGLTDFINPYLRD